jgi:hypothetical protein
VRYPATSAALLPYLLWQSPRLLQAVKNEHRWLLQAVKTHALDAVISDNRYGLHHPHLPSVIITHQLQPQVPFFSSFVRRLHYGWLSRFQACWVPDVAAAENLAGELSHPVRAPSHTQYLGWLSHLYPCEEVRAKHNQLLVLLSGLEPFRSQLSSLLWQQLAGYEGNIVFVEGNSKVRRSHIPSNIQWFPTLSSVELLPFMQEATYVLCRSGYSSLMDLIALRKQAILIPTPGQTEQEYLARYVATRGVFISFPQRNFKFNEAYKAALTFPYKSLFAEEKFNRHKEVLNEWLLSF